MTIRVREAIWHGDYRNIRYANISATWQGWVSFLQSSPYTMARNGADENPYVAMAFANLLTTGRASHGWADFTIE